MMTQHVRRLSAFAPSSSILSALAFSLLGVLGTAAPDTAHALSCLQDRMGEPVNCTANDVRITDVTNIVVTDDGCSAPGDTVTFNATLVIVTTATQRYDIGLFVGVDGVQALVGECRVRTLPTSPPPFYNFDNDACGDTSSTGTINLPVKNLTVNCVDVNGDEKLDFANCTSWRQNDNFTCNGPTNVEGGTPAKCNCPETPLDIDVPVPEPICTNATCNDGLFCNGVETCDPNVGCLAGTPPACGDAFGCTADACNEATDSCTHAPNNGLCSDGQFCNGVEVCSPTQGCVAGTPPACGDAFGCTADACNEATDSCVHTPNNSICNDGLFCNGTETCSATLGCRPGTAPNCGDGVACTVDACNEATDSCTHGTNNSACSDGLFCNGAEICTPQGCQAGTPPACGDAFACTQDSCNEATDSCNHTPNNGLCSDGQFCNGTEVCSQNQGCVAGTPPNCADSAACTQDACNEATDSCTHTPNNGACSDGQFCNGAEVCTANGCQAGTPPACGDTVACTIDTCNEATDSCRNTAMNSLCTDGLFCNGLETCSATQGCQAGTAPNCSDPHACTIDACNEASDSCTHTPNNTVCSDGQFCNGAETCSAQNGCQAGTAPNCADSAACTQDACNEATDSCTHTPNNGACSDGQFCNGAEICTANGCQAGSAPNCGDSVACTVDACNESTDSCTHAPTNSLCNDSQFCNGVETCDVTLGCQAGTGPNCSDNVPCTVDACNEATDSCTHAANNGLCDNGLFCDGTEICNALAGCQNGSPPNCVDSVPCTNDVCNEQLNRCDHNPDNSICADQSICTNDICDPTLGCTHVNNTAPCNDGNACTGNDTCQNGICIPRDDVCGNGVVDGNCGEQCDPGTSEICNNGIDDDGDTLIDCGDPNCAETQLPGCSAQCLPIPPCTPILNDPAIIYMPELDTDADDPSRSSESAPMGRFQFHGRIQPFSDVDPITDGFVLTLTNANGEIWRAEVLPGDIQQTARNRYAINATIGATATSSGGIAKLNIRKRRDEGILGYGIRVRAYGDFSRATLPEMTTQVYFNDDVGFLTAKWAKRPGRWTLFARHLDDEFVD